MLLSNEVVAQEGNDEVWTDETAFLVDESDAVGIAVKEQADVTFLLFHQGFDLLLSIGFQGIWLMVGEIAIQSVVDVMRLANQIVDEDGRHAVAAVYGNVEVVVRSNKLLLESELVGINIPFFDLAFHGTRCRGLIACHQSFQSVQSSVITYG